jgi:hypothetical protein
MEEEQVKNRFLYGLKNFMTEEKILIDGERSGYLITSRTHPSMGKVNEIVTKDHQFTGNKTAEKVNMKDVCDKMLLKNLTSEEMRRK